VNIKQTMTCSEHKTDHDM